jgi:hypothetical protein
MPERKSRQNRGKFVQVTLTDKEHARLKSEAENKRMSMSALLASSWLQNRAPARLTVPLSKEDSKQLELDAAYKGMTPWELLLFVWRGWRDDDHKRNPAMKGRHVKRETTNAPPA